MKTTIDFTDRVYEILVASGFADRLDGVYTDPEMNEPGKEFIVITTPGVSGAFDTVDTAEVTINLLIADVKGSSDVRRFRSLLPVLKGILETYNPHENVFVQYGRSDSGQKETVSTVTPTNEYFHINPVWDDGIHHDPERQGYSYYSIRTSCWIEK